MVHGDSVTLQAEAARFTAAQQQAVGPIEENASLTILQDGDAPTATVVAHDGQVGQVTSTTGALTFRTGDVFAGKDKEHMRLTEEGNLGIGTESPRAKLDVAGDIRATGSMQAEKGIEFADGTVQTSGLSGRKLADGTIAPNATGTGTQNRIAKWTDNAGTLGDSSLTDTGGNVGLGVTNPGDLLDIAGPPNASGRSGIRVRTTVSTGNTTLYFDNDRGNFAAYGGLLTGGSTNPFTFFGVTRADKTFLIADGPSSLGLGIGTLVSKPVIFGTANAERMRIDSAGNVGIGTIAPGQKLSVNGVIESISGGIKFPDTTIQTTAFAVPLSLSTSSANPIISATNTGTGRAGFFQINNGSNTNPALRAETNANGGLAAEFVNTNAAANIGIRVLTFGAVASDTDPGNHIPFAAGEFAGRVGIIGAVAPTNPDGSGVVGVVSNSGSADSAGVVGQNYGLGRGGLFQAFSPVSSTEALRAETYGTGFAATFKGVSNSFDSQGVYIESSPGQKGLQVAVGRIILSYAEVAGGGTIPDDVAIVNVPDNGAGTIPSSRLACHRRKRNRDCRRHS